MDRWRDWRFYWIVRLLSDCGAELSGATELRREGGRAQLSQYIDTSTLPAIREQYRGYCKEIVLKTLIFSIRTTQGDRIPV